MDWLKIMIIIFTALCLIFNWYMYNVHTFSKRIKVKNVNKHEYYALRLKWA